MTESVRVVSKFGTPNPRQITEDQQRAEESAAKSNSVGQSRRDPTEGKK